VIEKILTHLDPGGGARRGQNPAMSMIQPSRCAGRSLRAFGLLLATLPALAAPAVTEVPDGAIAGGAAKVETAAAGPSAGGRPRVCVVLSGGGARGAAHIGVIKVLEQLRVPVDCIAGTSMGAIVGGAYASGMSVDEMMSAIGQITTESLFNDAPPRADESMRTKSDDYLPLASPEFGTKGGTLTAPKGVVSGVSLEAELRRLVKLRGVRSFDRLPIPYRAVATSLGDGGMVVFERGELTTAMRASMSVPMMVAPMQVDGQLLVDGGLVRNLPVDVARAMGADVVIAVNLGTPLLQPNQIEGLTGVAMQTLSILTEQNVRESLQSLRPADVLIQPALGDFSAADFDNLVKAVPFGEAAARKAAPSLRALALPEAAYAALRARQSVVDDGPAPVIEAIEVAGQQRVDSEAIRQQMRTQPGQPLDQATLDLDMRRIFGSGDFESVRPDVREVDGRQTLVVNVTEKGWGPDYLRLGLQLNADLGQDATFNLYGNWRARWLNRYGAEWRNNVVLGNNVVLDTSFYQPLSVRDYFFVEPRLVLSNTPLDVYVGEVLAAEYRDQAITGSIDVGANFNQFGQARLGVFRGYNRFTLSSGLPSLPNGNVGTGGVQLGLTIDQLDSISFARSGYLFALTGQASLTALGASEGFNRAEGELRVAHAFGNHAFQIALRSGGPIGSSTLPVYALFQLGGFLNMSGYRQQQLLGPRYAYGRLSYQTRLAQVPLFEGVYGGLAYELADMPQSIAENNRGLFQSGTAYLAADTPLGTAYFGVGYGIPSTLALYLYLGKPF
jgi:NTE family protein